MPTINNGVDQIYFFNFAQSRDDEAIGGVSVHTIQKSDGREVAPITHLD